MTDERDSPEAGGMRIEADLVRQLAELLNQNELTEIEVVDGERRIVVKREVAFAHAPPAAAAPLVAAPPPVPPAAAAPAADVAPAQHPGAVKSPMVGTAYLSAEPGSKPFVSVGDSVREGETLLIVEAMKVMNPIVAPRAGTVRQVLVVDAQPVEFDQPLVIVE
ncbi:MAG: acetyl-CoA carboxylase biotin carboxyl carrier protein [Alphaproteobacteria bacterium]|nr:acetyl-CoA carboxylase biotin carboxyl carrier protein [Alphaproteobacteria bacterium]